MTENVCDSWEDVDVDNIVIKPANKLKTQKPTQLSILSKSANSSFNIEENGGNIVVKSSAASNAFKILQRPPNAAAPTSQAFSQAKSQQQPSPLLYSSVAATGTSPFEGQPKVVVEDCNRTQFVAPLRILNRPNSGRDQAKDPRSDVDIHKQLQKSFEEKQAEYAKARLRILGEEMPSENLNLDAIAESLDKVSMESTAEKASLSTSNKSSNNFPSQNLLNAYNGTNKSDVIIIREPTVPDGTRGFRYVR